MVIRFNGRRMLRPVLLILFLVPAAAVFARDDPADLYLWETRHGAARIYLAGSIHILDEAFYPLPGPMIDAADQADYLVLEADVANIDPQVINTLILNTGMYLDGSTLADHIPPKTWKRAVETAAENGLTEEQVMYMKPWLLGITLAAMSEALAGYDSALGMELYFSGEYPDLEILELEGTVRQLEFFSGLSGKDQLLLLESALDDSIDRKQMIIDILDAWKRGDDAAMNSLLDLSAGTSRSLNRRMITDRNRGIAERILELTGDSESVFLVLVGAAHFVGEQSLPTLLEESGLELQRIRSDGSCSPGDP